MSIISETLRTVIWFTLCIAMAVGMAIFAVTFMIFSALSRTFSWRENNLPHVKLTR